MNRIFNKIFKIKWLILIALIVLACETTQDTYKDFISEEIIYIGNPDDVIIGHGDEKLRFWVAINADPNINTGSIVSKNGDFTSEFDVVRNKAGNDTIVVDVNIPEGEYTFDISLFDNSGNASIGFEVGSVVYGSKYKSSLLNRFVTIEAMNQEAVFKWDSPIEGSIGTILRYEDSLGTIQEVSVDNDDTETVVPNYKLGGSVVITSTYRPSEASFEDFEAVPFETSFPEEFELDKSLIVPVPLAFDADDGNTSAGRGIAILFDGAAAGFPNQYNATGAGVPSAYPFVMTFDLGFDSNPSAIRVDPRLDCCGDRVPSTFQIWGYNGPDISTAETMNIKNIVDEEEGIIYLADWEADAVAKGWTKLLDYTTADPVPQTAIDDAGTGTFRYIRFVALASRIPYKESNWFRPNFTELTFWSR